MPVINQLLFMISAIVSDRNRLVLENMALRQQLAVFKRSAKRPNLHDSDRVFWILMRGLLRDWKDCLIIVKPETVIR